MDFLKDVHRNLIPVSCIICINNILFQNCHILGNGIKNTSVRPLNKQTIATRCHANILKRSIITISVDIRHLLTLAASSFIESVSHLERYRNILQSYFIRNKNLMYSCC